MSSIQGHILLVGSVFFLGACSQNTPTPPPVVSSPTMTPKVISSPTTANKTDSHGGQGGQVIESGIYHLELITINEANGTHIDFFLQKGDSHEPIPDAKVTAQVQLPDGSQQVLDMQYDVSGQHYYAVLSGTMAGEYKVAILSDIQGEKVNGRFRFQR